MLAIQLPVLDFPQIVQVLQDTAAKADADYGKALAPIPFVMQEQTAKQRFIAFKHFLERIQEQAFAKAARTGQKK